jgi:ArsR family metal-binding transcriptional regulator
MNSDKSSFISDLLFKGLLLENTTIKVLDISSCIADTSRIKYMAKIQRNLEDILPVLFLSTSNSKLTKKPLILSFTVQQHNFMLGQNGDLAVT